MARTIAFGLIAAIGSLGLAALTAEVAVRVLHPTPRVQVIRMGPPRVFRQIGDTWVWEDVESHSLDRHLDCVRDHPERKVALIVGDSIMYSYAPGRGQEARAFSMVLQDRYGGDGWCFVNLSEPAFHGWQQHAVAMEFLEHTRPDVLLWGVWKYDGRFVRLGDALYELSAFPVDDRGVPYLAELPLPASWNRMLFHVSAFWRYTVLALGARPSGDREAGDLEGRVLSAVATAERARALDVPMVLVVFPSLDRPFAQSVATPRLEPEVYENLVAATGARVIDVAEGLLGQDPDALRIDHCHYNQAGHQALADLIAERLSLP